MGAIQAKLIDVAVGQVIYRHRKRRRISLAHLANELGTTTSQLERYETGTNRLSMPRLFQLAEAMDVPPYYFVAEVMAVSSRILGTSGEDSPVIELLSSFSGQELVEAVARLEVQSVDGAIEPIARLAEQYTRQAIKNERPRNLAIVTDNDEHA